MGFLCFSTLCQNFTGFSLEFHQTVTRVHWNFSRISSEFHHNFARTSNWNTLKKGDDHNSAFPRFDSSRILLSRGGIPRPIGNSPESLSQQILAEMILSGRLGVPTADPDASGKTWLSLTNVVEYILHLSLSLPRRKANVANVANGSKCSKFGTYVANVWIHSPGEKHVDVFDKCPKCAGKGIGRHDITLHDITYVSYHIQYYIISCCIIQ